MMRTLLWAIGLFLSLPCFSQKIPLINSGQVIEEANAAYDSGDYENAIRRFLTVSERDTNYVYMLTDLSRAYYGAEDFDNAMAICDKGLKDPDIYKATFLRIKGLALGGKGEYEKAVQHFEKVIETYPTDYLSIYSLGITHYNQKNYEKAKDAFFRSLSINPYHAGAHLNLGRLSIVEGRKTHAMLSIGIYLALNNEDNENLVLLNNHVLNQVTDENTVKPTGPNEFEKLDQIIRAKIAMEKGFESAFDVDFAVVRQMEMLFQQLRSSATGSDPWAKFYLPIYNDLKNKNSMEPFVYHIIQSSPSDDVKKWIRKNEKAMKAFYSTANYSISQQRLNPVILPAIPGIPAGASGWYDDNKTLVALGNKTADGKKEGPWVYFFDNSERSAEGTYGKDEQKTGTWKYYYGNGNIKIIDNYVTGEYTSFYNSGGKFEQYRKKDEKIEGEVVVYYPCGLLKEKLTYKDGKIHGQGETYHLNGKVHKHYSYNNGEMDGEFTDFHDNGQVESRYTYRAGKAEGLLVEFDRIGNKVRSGEFVNDLQHGPWKYFYPSGKIDYEGSYKAGKGSGEWKYYNSRGELVERRSFNDKGSLHGENPYYSKGRMYCMKTFNDDVLVKVVYNAPDGKEVGSFGKSDGSFAMKDYFPGGELRAEGMMKKGVKHGKWKSYFRDGTVSNEYNYEQGTLQGEGVEYYRSGQKESVAAYKDGELDGCYQSFHNNGNVTAEGWYQAGERQQQWMTYHADGVIDEDNFFLNGEYIGDGYEYARDGKNLVTTSFDLKGGVENFKRYNLKGEVISVSRKEENKTRYEVLFKNKKPAFVMDITCGQYFGEIRRNYPDGKLMSSYLVSNKSRQGKFVHYNVIDVLDNEGYYVDGVLHGNWKKYYENGKADFTGKYSKGRADSTWLYYSPDGKVSSTSEYLHNRRDGITVYYSGDGTPALEKLYEDGDLLSYRTMTTGGTWTEWAQFKRDATIVAYYPNGKKSFEESYKMGRLHGIRRVSFSNGGISREEQFENGDYHGAYVFNYSNGKPFRKGQYKFDELDGLCQVYNEDGTLRLTENYSMGILHGVTTIYNKGVKLKEVHFWGGNIDE